MASKTLNVMLIMRNDTAANWASKNPVLTLGELGVETDTRKFKIGDGNTAYNSLKYGLGGNVEVKNTAPTASDVGYDIGTLWVDTTGTKAYILFAKTASTATWIGLLDSQGKIAVALIPSLTLSKISDAGTAAGKNVGTAAGNVPVLGSDGKLDESLLPAIAITETFVVDSQAAMLALSAQRGDVAVRTDENKSYILNADDPTVLANWVWLRTPDCKVLSVNSKTGAVVLTTSDIAEGANLYFTEARATANFNSNFKNKSVTELKDGGNVVLSTDTLTINGGKA